MPAAERSDVPSAWESMFTTLLVMGSAIIAASSSTPRPTSWSGRMSASFRALDFFQASAIIRAAEPVKTELKEKLGDAAWRRT